MENHACISKLGHLIDCVRSMFVSTSDVKCLDQVIMLPGYALGSISELQKKHPNACQCIWILERVLHKR